MRKMTTFDFFEFQKVLAPVENLKVLLLNTSERTGGAAVAAGRLLNALQKRGVDATMLVREKQTERPDVAGLNRSVWDKTVNHFRFLWERLTIFLCNKGSRRNLFRVSIANTGTDISAHPLVRQADVLHLHWINQGFLSLKDIKQLLRLGKPVVWTLHDLWPATGICHHPGECGKFESECCDDCPKLVKAPLWEMAGKVFREKKAIPLSEITFVGCSRWITEQTRVSALLRPADFHSIPNPIDTEIFKPVEKAGARKALGLPLDKYLILFAAVKLSDNQKGGGYFSEACRILKAYTSLPVEIVLMGNGAEELLKAFPFPVRALGYIPDEKKKVQSYAGADLFVCPSLEENLPNTIMEAMACGTPCVGFRTGGIPEMIDHKRNGYIARYKDSEDLAEGILWVMEHKEKERLSEACIEKVSGNYTEAIVSAKYMELYNKVLRCR